MNKSDKIFYTIVVPIYNEEHSVPILYDEIKSVMESMGKGYEIIFVDDGSTDGSLSVLTALAEKSKQVRVISFRKNFGQTAAISAGFDYSRGEIIVILDGDLQNDPADIPMLIETLNEGYDVVSGWRFDRHDKLLSRKLPSRIANKIISRYTGIHLHDYGCSLKAYRREVIKNIKLYGEMHRFLPAVANAYGITIKEVKVNHRPRKFGESKYSLNRVFKVILDLVMIQFFLHYATRPMQFFGRWGLLSIFTGVFFGLVTIAMKIFEGMDMTGNPFIFLTILCVLVGLQFFSIGIIGEINMRTYHESQNKPTYIISKTINL
jgi:glycosyltransferase involved in cell wall biosynthesis